MPTDIPTRKQELRKAARETLRGIRPDAWQKASVAVVQRITSSSAWTQAAKVLLYAPLPGELDVTALLREALDQGRTVALPRFDAASQCYVAGTIRPGELDLPPGHLGVPEPSSSNPVLPMNQLDFVLVPGVAFGLDGSRLGRGKGFYDRLLVKVTGAKCGICLDEQLHQTLPCEPHDVMLNYLVTPTRWISFGERKGLT